MLILAIILFVLAIIIGILIYFQSGDASELGPSLVGNQSIELFQQKKIRGKKKIVYLITLALIIAFLIFAIIMHAVK